MRVEIINEVHKIMKENKNSYYLTGDLGYHLTEQIENDFPGRFINTGVAEQNMIGIASGLALSGKKVFVSTIIPFILMRCFEQVRDDICYHNLDVTLLGIGGGMTYGILSSTHFALEDFALLRSLPNISIFAPADATEGILGMRYLKNYNKPLYVRICARSEPAIFSNDYRFRFGKGTVIEKGRDITIFVNGPIMQNVLDAAALLKKKERIYSTVVNIHSLKPLDKEIIIKEASNRKAVFTVEEHFEVGGLGSAVAEVLSELPDHPKLKIIGVENKFIKTVGTRSYLRSHVGLDSKGIYRTIINQLRKK